MFSYLKSINPPARTNRRANTHLEMAVLHLRILLMELKRLKEEKVMKIIGMIKEALA